MTLRGRRDEPAPVLKKGSPSIGGLEWLYQSRRHSSPELCEPGCQGAQQSDGKQVGSHRTRLKGRWGRRLLTQQKSPGQRVRKGGKIPNHRQ